MDWYPWGDEAFARARELGRPIFLSVGYSTCHWCHVMERESFEDEEVAALVNARFVAIKVDREERPDVDDVYMSAVQALNRGSGGWPMTLVLTPDGQPIFAATYLPARDGDRGSRRGLMSILTEVADAWDQDREGLVAHAGDLTAHLVRLATPEPPADVGTHDTVAAGVTALESAWDRQRGGFGGAPRFPRPANLDLLLRTGHLEPVQHTLRAMIRGGIHDQVGGGFHRYATDADWRVPHFEKMLYDNAQISRTLAGAWQATSDPELARAATRTVEYLLRELQADTGGFYSATDADSASPDGESQEGRFFTWTPDELPPILGPDAPLLAEVLGIEQPGNLDGRSVAWLARAPDDEERVRVDAGLQAMRLARAARPAPALDDKIVTAWNGLTISALARASLALDHPEWARAATRAADFVQAELRTADGRLHRTWAGGKAGGDGVLEDYTFMAEGYLDLFEATSDPDHVQRAAALMTTVQEHFADPAGGWFRTPDDGEPLLVRPRPDHDGAEPTGTAVGVSVLLRLADLTGEERWQVAADRVLAAYARPLETSPTSLPAVLAALDQRLAVPQEVLIVWPDGSDPTPLTSVVRRTWLPDATILFMPEDQVGDVATVVPWVEGKVALDAPTAYVCERGLCQRPTADPMALARLLEPR